MGTCFGISSNEDKLPQNFVLQRTISESTHFTVNSCASEQPSMKKSGLKRNKHQNKRSPISYFHENPLLKPLKSNKLYTQRKPLSVQSMDGSLSQIKEVPEKNDDQIRNKSSTLILNTKPKDQLNFNTRLSQRKQRSYSTHLYKGI